MPVNSPNMFKIPKFRVADEYELSFKAAMAYSGSHRRMALLLFSHKRFPAPPTWVQMM